MKKNFFAITIIMLSMIFHCRVIARPYSNYSDYLSGVNLSGYRQAQFADIDYDIVYVRFQRSRQSVFCPKSCSPEPLLNWNGFNDIWLSVSNNIYYQPGCDLVLHRFIFPPKNPGAEQVLVACEQNDTVNLYVQ